MYQYELYTMIFDDTLTLHEHVYYNDFKNRNNANKDPINPITNVPKYLVDYKVFIRSLKVKIVMIVLTVQICYYS